MSFNALEFHRQLVRTPSISGSESEIADFVADTLARAGINSERLGNTILATCGSGPHLVLNSHLDTVPASDSWSYDPWSATIEDRKVFGLGSNDAKASVAALTAAFLNAIEDHPELRISLMLSECEETSGAGTQKGIKWLESQGIAPEYALIGEPTGMASGIGQFGLVIADLVSFGDSCHSANASRMNADNALYRLARDLIAIQPMNFGESSVQPTILQAGEVHNRLPDRATATLDIRLSPEAIADEIIDGIRSAVRGEVQIRSDRLKPYACPSESILLQCVPEPKFTSNTMSDQVFFSGIPAVKIGPGDSSRSHTADEFVFENEILEAIPIYDEIIAKLAAVAT